MLPAGMCLIDTTDGALMMTLYTSTYLARDTIAILYYSIVLSAITVVVAILIGIIQLLSLVANFSTGRFWDGVDAVGDHFDIIGGGICGAFVVFGLLSVIVYRPWRRWVEKNRVTRVDVEDIQLTDIEKLEKENPEQPISSREIPELDGV
jgi:nickel/cobalt transporter (NiCoT) family protein